MLNEAEAKFTSPADALRAGVGMVHQELAFCPDLSVAENLVMGQYPRRLGVLIDRKDMTRRAEARLAEIGVDVGALRFLQRWANSSTSTNPARVRGFKSGMALLKMFADAGGMLLSGYSLAFLV